MGSLPFIYLDHAATTAVDPRVVEAIREHVDVVGANAGVRITVDAPPTLPEIPAAIEVAAFRVVQEALNNVIRHAQARHCAISIAAGSGLHIRIEDDGVWLPQETRSGVVSSERTKACWWATDMSRMTR